MGNSGLQWSFIGLEENDFFNTQLLIECFLKVLKHVRLNKSG